MVAVVVVVVVVSCCKAEMRFLLGLPRRNTSTISPEEKEGFREKTSKSINFEQRGKEYPQQSLLDFRNYTHLYSNEKNDIHKAGQV